LKSDAAGDGRERALRFFNLRELYAGARWKARCEQHIREMERRRKVDDLIFGVCVVNAEEFYNTRSVT
jgi:hypothetical protein